MTKHSSHTNKAKTPWPTKAAMEQVYEMKLWGENQSEFYSGDGSHLDDLVHPYIDVITSFLTQLPSPPIVCDLGCGDFNIGKQLVKYTQKYIAIDIVPNLIAYNKENFNTDNLEFHCLDLAADPLPKGDCAILRQVLQHLSNSEIQNILNKLTAYKYVIITEHIPNSDFIPNADIISGQGIRLKKHSGVNVLATPFNLKAKDIHQLLSLPLNNGKEVIVTTSYTLY
ncbi:methyltransferase [Formosa agariphila KMM 3901]|uniref:Methyltransferase n=1 Tax=Formosa agariphila (strain DSM 15362 / KCTC 12365 / LMG 23005 / KMM 3901 / M-2Alg 35-1) TaxID=1347342 RepID=T2KJV9_FORAG|nr:class I SAM-dependent methyltransferase [Formosa agariphila]CDF79050.1 methyltransferase [Formosa agariphila KMM 3901]